MDLYRHQGTGVTQKRLFAPAVFGLINNRSRTDLLIFLDDLRKFLTPADRRVHIDFSRTTKMYVDGTLLFFAELDELVRMSSKHRALVTCSYPKDEVVEQVLQHIGVFDLLKKECRATVEDDTVKHWHRASGTMVEGEQVQGLKNRYDGTMASPLIDNHLFVGLTEAMTNSGQHAYPQSWKDRGVEPRWWMFSQLRDEKLYVTFCDLGIGIPQALSTDEDWEPSFLETILSELGFVNTEGALIRAAFEVGRSQTKKPNRGKGLQDVRQVLDNRDEGALMVFSGRGLYIYEPYDERFHSTKGRVLDYSKPSRGTLIYWKLPILKEESREKGH